LGKDADVTRVSFLDWTFDVDIDATRVAYRAVETCAPEACGCDYCKNWVLARELAYPASILEFLRDVGIEHPCEAETWESGPIGPGLRRFGGFLHFIGRITDGPQPIDSHQSPDMPYAQVDDRFNVWFWHGAHLVLRGLKGRDLVQMEFHTVVPWLLDTPEPP
jgi:hypothetical protein